MNHYNKQADPDTNQVEQGIGVDCQQAGCGRVIAATLRQLRSVLVKGEEYVISAETVKPGDCTRSDCGTALSVARVSHPEAKAAIDAAIPEDVFKYADHGKVALFPFRKANQAPNVS
jgi:hypothetical protein